MTARKPPARAALTPPGRAGGATPAAGSRSLGQAAYETYAKHMDAWRRWQDLRPSERAAWEAAATAALEECGG